jgi:Zn-dependent peptidase ImmA (M78 family)
MSNPKDHARRIISELAIVKPAVSLERIAKHLKIQIRHSPLDNELSGMAVIKNGEAIVGVNSLHHPNRQRFTIAHEIGHHVMHGELLTGTVHIDREFKLMRNENSATGNDKREREANLFASELLMPEVLIVEALQGRGIDIEDEDGLVAELAKKFKVSTGAMKLRLARLMMD